MKYKAPNLIYLAIGGYQRLFSNRMYFLVINTMPTVDSVPLRIQFDPGIIILALRWSEPKLAFLWDKTPIIGFLPQGDYPKIQFFKKWKPLAQGPWG